VPDRLLLAGLDVRKCLFQKPCEGQEFLP